MDFQKSRSDVIRSVTQRWLYNQWRRLRADRALPLWKDLPAEDLASQMDTLIFCDVVMNGRQPRFKIQLLGRLLMKSYGGDRRGEFLDEVLPLAWQPGALGTYKAAVEQKVPVFNIVPTGDRDGREVYMERLLLPFSHDGIVADRVLASIETVSEGGRFDQNGLATSPNLRAECEGVNLIEDAPANAGGEVVRN